MSQGYAPKIDLATGDRRGGASRGRATSLQPGMVAQGKVGYRGCGGNRECYLPRVVVAGYNLRPDWSYLPLGLEN